jgi:hypothetical protein
MKPELLVTGGLTNPADGGLAQFHKSKLTTPAFAMKVVLVTLITLVLFAVFVAVFYFTCAAGVEREVVQTSVEEVVMQLSSGLKTALPPTQAAALGQLVKEIQLPDMAAADVAAKAANSKLLKQSLLIMGVSAAVIIIVVVVAQAAMKAATTHRNPSAKVGIDFPSLGEAFRISAITFVGVVAVEFGFLYGVARNYKPLDVNVVKGAVAAAVSRNIQQRLPAASAPPSTTTAAAET